MVDSELVASPNRDYWEVQDLYLSLLEDSLGPLDLGPAGQQALLPIALSREHGSGQAQAWMTLLGGGFGEQVVLPNHDQPRAPVHEQRPRVLPPTPFINVHPNPSDGPVVVVCRLPEGAQGGHLLVQDPLGRSIHQQLFQGEMQLLDLDTRTLATGVYTAVLEADGIRIGVAKFELVR